MELTFDETLNNLVESLYLGSLMAEENELQGIEIDSISAYSELTLNSRRIKITLSIQQLDD